MIFIKNNPTQKVSYGELARGQKVARYMGEKPEFKNYSELKSWGNILTDLPMDF